MRLAQFENIGGKSVIVNADQVVRFFEHGGSVVIELANGKDFTVKESMLTVAGKLEGSEV